MQAETEGLCAIEEFDSSFIPVEILPSEVPTKATKTSDALSVVELGKQLLQSAKNGDTNLVRDLMCKGAPFTTDWLGTSALHLAAQNNHTLTAEVLLRAGISRDARTKVDKTPLHMAAYEGHHEMAQLLLGYGADVDSRDMLKMTPLHWAVEQEHAEVMLVLLEHGADPNATSKFNKSPITLALEHDRLDLVDMLQQEREIINVQANQARSAEIEAATQNLMQMEAEREQEENAKKEYEEMLQKQRLEQLNAKKQRMVLQQIKVKPVSNDNQVRTNSNKIADKNTNTGRRKQKHATNLTGVEQPLRFLQAHGITMIPVDNDSTIVENAMESGQTVVLTEAGKMALNLTKSTPLNITPMKRLQVNSKTGIARKVITIRADQIFNQTPTQITARAPNILKKLAGDAKSPGQIFITSLGNSGKLPTVAVKKPAQIFKKLPAIPKIEPVAPVDDEIDESFEGDEEESITDIVELNRKLQEARKQAEEYRRQLIKKEQEAELYEQQLRNMVAQKAMMN
ncbi:hypothetical protein QAD02_010630 [Eretmocerus hayati]|uniref:Uncharacterized protein n=1 Tax=Eretmocerus hayati TaxID=131215 RepID=A0ACC2NUD9_9HYME|nr:hypothetical protein QAD02_010630 [Eretmocerus hayati]